MLVEQNTVGFNSVKVQEGGELTFELFLTETVFNTVYIK